MYSLQISMYPQNLCIALKTAQDGLAFCLEHFAYVNLLAFAIQTTFISSSDLDFDMLLDK